MSEAKSILGSNGFAQIFITDSYYVLLCFKSMTLDIEDEEIEKTSINSGRAREYTTGLSSGTLSVSGVTTIENTATVVSALYMLQHRNEEHLIQLSYTSQDSTTKGISFSAILRRTTLSNDVTQWAQSSLEFRISGDIDTGAIIDPPVAPTIFSDYWDVTAGTKFVTGLSETVGKTYSLSGINLVAVYREGIEYDIVTSSPGNRQARYVSGTPSVEFQINFEPGETVFIIFTT